MKRRHRYRFLLLQTPADPKGAGGLFHVIDNTANQLNSVQDDFVFDFERDVIACPDLPLQPDGSVHEDDAREEVLRQRRKLGIAEYPIAVLAAPLYGGTWANIEDDSTVISLHSHADRSARPAGEVLRYLAALAVLEQLVQTPSHDSVHGCVNDFCDPSVDPRYLDVGMETGSICNDCLSIVHNAVAVGQVAPTAVASVQRILDAVARRKVCFLITPMNDRIQPVLAEIKAAAERRGVLATGSGDELRAGLIMHRVVGTLARATSCIVDLTDLRPNVLYELGWADALRKPALLLCPRGQALPFDLGHREVCFYDPEQLAATLSPRVEAFLAG